MKRSHPAEVRSRMDGDPAQAARTFIGVLDHWERGAPGLIPQQWNALHHVARLLGRLGADPEAARLHRALLGGGMKALLTVDEVAGAAEETAMSGPEAVDFARAILQRYC